MKPKCSDPHCPGWAVYNGTEVKRCDECGVFKTDEEAGLHVQDIRTFDPSTLPSHVYFDGKNNFIRCQKCGMTHQLMVGPASEALRIAMEFAVCHKRCRHIILSEDVDISNDPEGESVTIQIGNWMVEITRGKDQEVYVKVQDQQESTENRVVLGKEDGQWKSPK